MLHIRICIANAEAKYCTCLYWDLMVPLLDGGRVREGIDYAFLGNNRTITEIRFCGDGAQGTVNLLDVGVSV